MHWRYPRLTFALCAEPVGTPTATGTDDVMCIVLTYYRRCLYEGECKRRRTDLVSAVLCSDRLFLSDVNLVHVHYK
jgi:hypothetical protein